MQCYMCNKSDGVEKVLRGPNDAVMWVCKEDRQYIRDLDRLRVVMQRVGKIMENQ